MRQRHSSYTTPNIKHLLVGTQLSVFDEIAEMLFSGSGKIPVTRHAPDSMRRKIEAAG
jgi:hypothetical protein